VIAVSALRAYNNTVEGLLTLFRTAVITSGGTSLSGAVGVDINQLDNSGACGSVRDVRPDGKTEIKQTRVKAV